MWKVYKVAGFFSGVSVKYSAVQNFLSLEWVWGELNPAWATEKKSMCSPKYDTISLNPHHERLCLVSWEKFRKELWGTRRQAMQMWTGWDLVNGPPVRALRSIPWRCSRFIQCLSVRIGTHPLPLILQTVKNIKHTKTKDIKAIFINK